MLELFLLIRSGVFSLLLVLRGRFVVYFSPVSGGGNFGRHSNGPILRVFTVPLVWDERSTRQTIRYRYVAKLSPLPVLG